MHGGQGLPGARRVPGEQADPDLERPHAERRPERVLAREVPVGLGHPALGIAVAPARHGQRREREGAEPGGLVVVRAGRRRAGHGRVCLQVTPVLAGLELDHAHEPQHRCVVVVAHGDGRAVAAHQRVGVLGAADGHQAEDVRQLGLAARPRVERRVGEAALDLVGVLLVVVDALDEVRRAPAATGRVAGATAGRPTIRRRAQRKPAPRRGGRGPRRGRGRAGRCSRAPRGRREPGPRRRPGRTRPRRSGCG